MLASNPFAELSASVSPGLMKTYVFVMILFVVGGTLFDIWHKKSAKYFFANWQKTKDKATTTNGGGVAEHAVQTAAFEVLASSEFCNPKRRIAHLFTMYGFIAYVLSTVVLVFGYASAPATATPFIWMFLWVVGAIMVCIGGYWFWFFIRADVSAEGQSPFRLMRADLFIVSLLACVTFGLIWAITQATVFLGLYVIATTILFGSVPWSKFSHMFFKPAAALQKRVANANGSRNNLPPPVDKPAILGSARRQPSHY